MTNYYKQLKKLHKQKNIQHCIKIKDHSRPIMFFKYAYFKCEFWDLIKRISWNTQIKPYYNGKNWFIDDKKIRSDKKFANYFLSLLEAKIEVKND